MFNSLKGLFSARKPKVWPDWQRRDRIVGSVELNLVTFTDGSRAYMAKRGNKIGYGWTEIEAYRALFDAIELAREQAAARV